MFSCHIETFSSRDDGDQRRIHKYINLKILTCAGLKQKLISALIRLLILPLGHSQVH